MFPKELVIPCIRAGSEEGDYVLDPFSGAGTTGIVALEEKRNYIGVENSQKYAQLSVDRFKAELGDDVRIDLVESAPTSL